MHEYVRRSYLPAASFSAEQQNEVRRRRAGASLQNIQPANASPLQDRPVPSKISSLETKVIVFLLLIGAAREGINNLFGCGGRSVKLKTAQMIHVSTHVCLHLELLSTDSRTAFTSPTVRGVLLELVKLQMMCLLAC